MNLPSMSYADGIAKGTQTAFAGLDHNLGAPDGSIWDMENLTGDYYPLLSPRDKRSIYTNITQPYGMGDYNGLYWVSGSEFVFNGEVKGQVTPSKKTFCAINSYIVIMPDKKYYNVTEDEFGSLEASVEAASLTFKSGTYAQEKANANTIYSESINWEDYFKAGDAVTIDGCTKHTENNLTIIVREISEHELRFYPESFKLDGDDGLSDYTESGQLTIKRTMPDLKYMCENENRLWGCDDNTIYACKLGDPFNWNVFDGLNDDSYSVITGSAGSFTACCSYLGYPIFFKEDHIYKVYGSYPSNFSIMSSASMGVAAGSDKSLAIAGETLYYLSRAGFVAYSGGIPQVIHRAFGKIRLHEAIAGSDGLKYYVCAADKENIKRIYVYDTQTGMWHIEDKQDIITWVFSSGALHALTALGDIMCTDVDKYEQKEEDISWHVEFGDYTENDPNKKGLSKIQIRLQVDTAAEVNLYMKFDSCDDWLKVSDTLEEGVKRSYYLPIVPRRVDHYRYKLEGKGSCKIYSLSKEYYSGSELRSKPGRQ